jgi:hypothetical protein
MAYHYPSEARGRPVLQGSIYERWSSYWIVTKVNQATGIVRVRSTDGYGGFWTSVGQVDSWNLVRRGPVPTVTHE